MWLGSSDLCPSPTSWTRHCSLCWQVPCSPRVINLQSSSGAPDSLFGVTACMLASFCCGGILGLFPNWRLPDRVLLWSGSRGEKQKPHWQGCEPSTWYYFLSPNIPRPPRGREWRGQQGSPRTPQLSLKGGVTPHISPSKDFTSSVTSMTPHTLPPYSCCLGLVTGRSPWYGRE